MNENEFLDRIYREMKEEYEKKIGRKLSDKEFSEIMNAEIEKQRKEQERKEKEKIRYIVLTEMLEVPQIHAEKISKGQIKNTELLKVILKELKENNFLDFKIGNFILRSETASIVSVSCLISNYIFKPS